ncbi:MAG: hypothetical protein ABSE95_18450 [Thermodesulfobacteriota bacterium]|jgi:hypothetical protein
MKRIFWGSIVLAVFFVSLFPQEAAAIPAFARKYRTTCTTCHTVFPKLSALGEAFRLNGYKLPDTDELYVKDQPVSMGAEPYKKVFPNSLWPSDIPGTPPFSIRTTGAVNVNTGGANGSHNNTDFNFPGEIDLLAAGNLGKDFSFFMNLAFTDEAGTTNTNGLVWLMWQNLCSNILGTNHLNIKAGNVGRQSIALPNSRDENSFTVNGYLYQDVLNLQPQPGFQVEGFGSRWRYYAGIVQTNSDNSAKDYYGGLSFKIGGLGFDGSGLKSEEGGLNTSPSGYWRDDSILFGLFGYRAYTGPNACQANRYGADLRVNYKDLSLGAGYIRETGNVANTTLNQPPSTTSSTNTTQNLWFIEGHYFVFPWLIPYARYESLTVETANNQDLARIIGGLAFLIRANIKLNVEYMYYTINQPREAAGQDKSADDLLSFQLDFTF